MISQKQSITIKLMHYITMVKHLKKTIEAVNKITGLNLKYYILVDTEALIKLVDQIGGLYFDVPIDMNYDDPTQDLYIHLSKGYQN